MKTKNNSKLTLRNFLKVLIGLIISAVFLWLSFRTVNFGEFVQYITRINILWIFPFTLFTVGAAMARAERWKIVTHNVLPNARRNSYYTAVMMGYGLNFVVPRLGEVGRGVYLGRLYDKSHSQLLGTVVLDRVLDMLCLGILFLIFVVAYVSTPTHLEQLIGETNTAFVYRLFSVENIIISLVLIAVIIILIIYLQRWLKRHVFHQETNTKRKLSFLPNIVIKFMEGLMSLFTIKHWGSFVFYTILIWAFYASCLYSAFWMLDDIEATHSLGFQGAFALTVVCSFGVIAPTPGGLGSYHYFVTQFFVLFYGISDAVGLTYATVTHATTIIITVVFLILFWSIERHLIKKEKMINAIQ